MTMKRIPPYNGLTIAIDFDGTLCKHRFPEIGEDIGAIEVLKLLIDNGHRLILNTMRCDDTLNDAVEWLSSKGITLWGVNCNREQGEWTSSPKVHADMYIDDLALGIPRILEEPHPYVDWSKVKELLIRCGAIKPEQLVKRKWARPAM